MRLPVTIVAVALAVGCAPAKQGLARIRPRGEGALPAASADVRGLERILVLRSATTVLRERGLRIASHEPDRIVTAPRELDVPCGSGTCLARELFVVAVADGRARVELLRGVWEPGGRCWEMTLAPSTAADATAREAELLRAIVEPVQAAARGARPAAISLAPR
jgi:hypothetical protein